MVVKKQVVCGFCSKKINRYPTKTDIYFCNTDCKAKWQVFQREKLGFTKDWLIDQYFNQGKNCNLIGKEIGRDGKSVWNWFKWYNIEISKRGSNYKNNLILDGSPFRGKSHTQEFKNKIREQRKKDGHVPYLKNGVHWLKGVTKDNHPTWKGGLTPERQSFYSSEEWVESVKGVWKRDKGVCQNCGKHHNTELNRGNFHIHHIVSFQIRELRSDIKNLVLLCKDCHRWVHSNKNKNKLWLKNN